MDLQDPRLLLHGIRSMRKSALCKSQVQRGPATTMILYPGGRVVNVNTLSW